jgi:hypothetical protein
MSRKKRPGPLLLRVMTEIGKGRITEGYLTDRDCFTEGYIDGGHIHINPTHLTVDALLHEAIHRAYPSWPETYVRNRVTFLRKRLTDAETQEVYRLYNEVKRTRKRALDVTDR